MEFNQLFNIKAGFPEALNAWTVRHLEDWGPHREVWLKVPSPQLSHFRNCPPNNWAAPEMGWTEPLLKTSMATEVSHGLYLPHQRCIVYYKGFRELSVEMQYIRRTQLRMQAFLHSNTIKGL